MSNDQIKVLYTNIRSLSAHYDELLLLLQSRSEQGQDYDIIALSETWVKPENLKLFPIRNYATYIAHRDDGRRSGGVVYYVKESLQIRKNETVNIQGANVLKLKLQHQNQRSNGKNNELIMYLLYRDCTSPKQSFVESLEQELLKEKRNNVVIFGDLNIDLLDERESSEYLNMLMSQGCLSFQNCPTRENSCLDHVFANHQNVTCKLLETQINDHATIEISVLSQDTYQRLEEKKIEITNEELFQKYIREANWKWVDEINVNDEISVNKDFDRLIATIQACRKRATKIKLVNNTQQLQGRKKRQPWMTVELLSLISKKSQAYLRHRRKNDDSQLKEEFKLLSAQVKKAIRAEKVKYYSKILDNNYANAKKYWEIINEARGKKMKEENKVINVSGEIITSEKNPNKMAEEFNHFFNNVTDNLIRKAGLDTNICDSDKHERRLDQGSKIGEGMGYRPTLQGFSLTEGDIERAILSLKNKPSIGVDGVSSRTIKALPKFFSRILLPLFNKSLKQGIFPDVMKRAIIAPAEKGGDLTQMTNYRPIALLPCLAKVFEKCVKEKILNFLNHINFLSEQQFGFTKNKSTDTALFTHITNIVECIEENNAAVGVYIDLAKAFDTVNHTLMVKKLENIGFQGPLLSWLTSYLSNRKQCVKINGVLSSDLQIKHGVPQGSVLGPLLFIIYMNDMFELPLRGKITGYADDTSLLYSAKTVKQVNEDFKHDEGILTAWFKENYLHLNINKSCFIIYSYMRTKWNNDIKLKIGDENLNMVRKVKYLGLLFDEKMTWREHSIELQVKLRKLNFLFFHLKKFFNEKHLKKLYQPLYESVFSYGIIHWGASKHIQPLKILQNKVCKNILSLPLRTTEKTVYEKMKVNVFEEVYQIKLLIFLFKNQDLFELRYNKRTRTRLTVSKVATTPGWKKEHSRMQARYQGAKLFQNLSSEIRDEVRLMTFKRQVKMLFEKRRQEVAQL